MFGNFGCKLSIPVEKFILIFLMEDLVVFLYRHTLFYCTLQILRFLQTEGQGIISAFKSYYLRITFIRLQLPQIVIPLMDLGKVN
jgi:hypothetical protein